MSSATTGARMRRHGSRYDDPSTYSIRARTSGGSRRRRTRGRGRRTWLHGGQSSILLAALLLLITLMPGRGGALAQQSFPATWLPTGSMTTSRVDHTATLLPSGQVLVAGGCADVACNTALASAELYDPSSGTWTATGSMSTPRHFHTATFLPNGKVLVAGGLDGTNTQLASAELYDPATGTWAPTASMHTSRYGHTATLLPSGQVLVVSGGTTSAELYDPATGTWTVTGSLSVVRYNHSAVLLPSGQVLVVGGRNFHGKILASAEVYAPGSGTWTAIAGMHHAHSNATATLLPSREVLVAGGLDSDNNPQSSAELYDPRSGTWSLTGSMASARAYHTATLLTTGQVLVAGGQKGSGTALADAELYDPSTGTWSTTATMNDPHAEHTATLLSNGQVLVAGGGSASAERYVRVQFPLVTFNPNNLHFGFQFEGIASTPQTVTVINSGVLPLNISSVAFTGTNSDDFVQSNSCMGGEIAPTQTCDVVVRFKPTGTGNRVASLSLTDNAPTSPQSMPVQGVGILPNMWAPTGAMLTGHADDTATRLLGGDVLVVGGDCCFLRSAELYDPHSDTWQSTGALATGRRNHTATLLDNGQVLVAGGCGNPNCTVLSSAELYDPAARTWRSTGSMSAARWRDTATKLTSGSASGGVLVTGGCSDALCTKVSSSAELYEWHTGTWTNTGSMSTPRQQQTATLLPSGEVLVAGGKSLTGTVLASAELYNPLTGTWTRTGSMTTARYGHTATLLADGKVLVAGGGDGSGNALASAELYDPSTGTWTATGSMSTPRANDTATYLHTGQVLVVGGCGGTPCTSAELYHETTGTWTPAGALTSARANQTATLLGDGQVLVAGGDDSIKVAQTSAEVYTADLSVYPPSGTVGQSITVTGTNYFPNEPVKLYWDSTSGTPVATATTDNAGNFSLPTSVIPDSYGNHPLYAVGQHSGAVGQTNFQIEPRLTLNPNAGAAGSQAVASGAGFGPQETVALHWSAPAGPLLGTTTSDATGSFAGAGAITFTVPLTATAGTYPVYALGQSSGAQAVATFTVR